VHDVRWFAPNRYCALVVPRLLQKGWSVALDGDAPARLVVSMDAQVATAAFSFARRHRCAILVYLWDLPPWRLGRGRPDLVFALGDRLLRIPWPGRRYPQRAGYYSRLRFVASRAAEVWVPSRLTLERVGERFGLRCRQVPFCYDSDRFVPGPPFPAKGGAPVLLSISRLTPHKNQAAVLRAAARFEPRLAVRLIGAGDDRAALAELAADLGVQCSIESGLDDQAVLAAYRSASVVVCPSRFEGFGLTPIEGVACGVPVVASDIPPHREFLGDSVEYFPLDDDAALVAAIRRAMVRPPVPSSPLAPLSIDAAAARFDAGLQEVFGRLQAAGRR